MNEPVTEQRREFSLPALVWTALLIIGAGMLIGALVLALRRDNLTPEPTLYGLVIAGALIILLAGLGLEQRASVLGRRLNALRAEQRRAQQADEARARSLYDLAFLMGSTLDYQKILEAALEAGRLALRDAEHGDGRLAAAVLLFHADDDQLHVVSGRRLTRADEGLQVAGKDGVIAEALRTAEPIISAAPGSDAELQYFVAFQKCRSVLCIPLRTGFDNFGVLLYGADRADAFNIEQADLLRAVGIQATIALQNALLYRQLQDEKERIIEVEEEARKKLARDLHDGPTQSIAAIAMRMNYVSKLIQRHPEQAPAELQKVEELARRTTKEIRHMLFTLRPLVLETHGLTAALNQLADKMLETHGQTVTIQTSRELEQQLDHNQQGVIFYVAEEAINNARKHAQAQSVRVNMAQQGNYAVVRIMDNGVGFDAQAVSTNYESRGSLGMMNMRERAELVDGTLTVDSVPGKGTIITLLLPLRGAGHTLLTGDSPRGVTKLALAASERAPGAADADLTR